MVEQVTENHQDIQKDSEIGGTSEFQNIVDSIQKRALFDEESKEKKGVLKLHSTSDDEE